MRETAAVLCRKGLFAGRRLVLPGSILPAVVICRCLFCQLLLLLLFLFLLFCQFPLAFFKGIVCSRQEMLLHEK